MKKNTSHFSLGRILAPLLIGTGLIAIGVMLVLLLSDQAAASTQDFSTVPVQVDFPAPELTLTNLDGEAASLADYRGKTVLVNLWATWCPPCREEMPTLLAFYEEYKSKDFVLIAVNQGDTAQDVELFVAQYGLTFPVWLDQGSAAGRAFSTMNLPSSYVIDRGGQVRLMWICGISKKNLEKHVPTIIME